LVLGTGGASRAVQVALEELNIEFRLVSQQKKSSLILEYEEIDKTFLAQYQLIINTTPLGMYPNVHLSPNLPYQYCTSNHYLYDLVYNPLETSFMKQGLSYGAKVKNGLEMLYLQAEKAWQIWNS
jgi:shikimate dehydrogenase